LKLPSALCSRLSGPKNRDYFRLNSKICAQKNPERKMSERIFPAIQISLPERPGSGPLGKCVQIPDSREVDFFAAATILGIRIKRVPHPPAPPPPPPTYMDDIRSAAAVSATASDSGGAQICSGGGGSLASTRHWRRRHNQQSTINKRRRRQRLQKRRR
jgi:hypothetical protein